MERQISLTAALVELKTLDKRIQKKVRSNMVAWKIGNEIQTDSDTEANFDSVRDLIAYRAKIKAAVIRTNATTEVKVGSQTMTIAEAIEFKNSTLEYLRELYRNLDSNKRNTVGEIAVRNQDAQHRLDRLLEANLSKDLKTRKDEFENITNQFWLTNKAQFVDTEKIEKRLRDLYDTIEQFESNVDIALSEINARTTILVTD